jgi:hypothetical protein
MFDVRIAVSIDASAVSSCIVYAPQPGTSGVNPLLMIKTLVTAVLRGPDTTPGTPLELVYC